VLTPDLIAGRRLHAAAAVEKQFKPYHGPRCTISRLPRQAGRLDGGVGDIKTPIADDYLRRQRVSRRVNSK